MRALAVLVLLLASPPALAQGEPTPAQHMFSVADLLGRAAHIESLCDPARGPLIRDLLRDTVAAIGLSQQEIGGVLGQFYGAMEEESRRVDSCTEPALADAAQYEQAAADLIRGIQGRVAE